MQKIKAIASKELQGYFRSPVAYIILIATVTIFNYFFYLVIDLNGEATLRDIFKVMEFLFIFIIPILTMKTFAEEKQNGTMEFLMTTPTRNRDIVLGKYLGSLLFYSLIIAMTGVYYVIIEVFGDPDRLATLGGFIGIWLEGALFIAVGIMASSWTKNQVVAAITAYAILFLLYFSKGLAQYVPGVWESVVLYVCTLSHADNFSIGLVYSTDIIYYVSITILCLCLAHLSIEKKLWD